MTEQKEILEIISNRAFDIQHTDTLQVAFNKAKEIQELVDGQQPFKIGEYYKRPDNDICKITSIENDTA
ncbi:hypothetical protein, partial [uncultured Enterococcus sp.]|uniref:hypothetical protein n=1 Tax=uncultured Enterococcus sp. TaxID=167972 RepID=UPI002AA720DD